jgi:hypothetical protein
MMMVVTMMIAVPSRGWSRAADGDCADNAQCRSNFRYGSHDAFLLLVLSSFDDTLVALNAAWIGAAETVHLREIFVMQLRGSSAARRPNCSRATRQGAHRGKHRQAAGTLA